MNQHYAACFWRIASTALKASAWIIAIILLGFSALVVAIGEGSDSPKLLGIAKATWLSIAGSLLASAIFFIVHNLLSILQNTREDISNSYFKSMHDDFGLKAVYAQRGATDIQMLYQSLIATASRRIWAIGMTNKSFMEQSAEQLLRRCEHIPSIDARIAFWDPETSITIRRETTYPIFEIQSQLEEKGDSGIDWKRKMAQCLVGHNLDTPSHSNKPRVFTLSLVTNISCFIIDDDVFFFPFLGRSNSNLDPHIHCSASVGVGKLILEHYSRIFSNDKFCQERHSTP